MSLVEQIEQAKADLARLERQALRASCQELGHTWKYIGGANCGCDREADCSVPVYECLRCGGCDYGQNAEAEDKRAACALLEAAERGEP